jgi:hypothetical protein
VVTLVKTSAATRISAQYYRRKLNFPAVAVAALEIVAPQHSQVEYGCLFVDEKPPSSVRSA